MSLLRRTVVTLAGLVTVSAVVLSAPSGQALDRPPAGSPAGPPAGSQAGPLAGAVAVIDPATTPIKHVVVVYQENHSFDDVLGAVCRTRTTPCDGFTGAVTFADGETAPNVVEPDIVPNMAHSPVVSALGIDNRWDRIVGCRDAPYACVTHYRRSGIPNLATLADEFAVSDRTFAAGGEVSFGAHVELAAGTQDGFYGFNPQPSTTGHTTGPGWGCTSFRDARWGADGTTWVPSCVPAKDGSGPYRPSPVRYTRTIMQNMEAAGLTWHSYIDAPSGVFRPSSGTWSVCTYFAWCLQNRFTLDWTSPKSTFFDDAAHGRLPNLSFLLPVQEYSQHNNASMAVGDNYIGAVLDAVMRSRQWSSTAVFITYDDCGCFYDHVTPPTGLGMRNPMVIVSPWVKASSTDSTVAVQPYSVLSFIDHNFGLPDLTPAVGAAYDYHRSFDFGQTPLAPVPMTRQHVTAATRERVRELTERYGEDIT